MTESVGKDASAMKPLGKYQGSVLEWVQPSGLRRYHELWGESELYATLTWHKAYGSLATAESSEGTFTLKRGGFLHPYVTLREPGSLEDLAVFRLSYLKDGVLEFRDGRRYLLRKLSLWKQEWGFFDEYERPLCSVKRSASLKHSGDVRIERDTRKDQTLLILLSMAWYMIVLSTEESAGVVVTSVVLQP